MSYVGNVHLKSEEKFSRVLGVPSLFLSIGLTPLLLLDFLCSCFANVVLQCLTYTRPVAAYLLEGGHSEDCKSFSTKHFDWRILFCNIWFYSSCPHFDYSVWVLKMFRVSASVIVERYCEFLCLYFPLFWLFLTPVCFATGKRDDWCFMCELQSHLWKVRQSHNPFSPIRILSRIRNIGNHLGYGRQEDAHEFMRYANYYGGQSFTWITG